jgi:hypothetical protein
MKVAAWIVFGLCSVFMLMASAVEATRVWSIVLHNPYGFSYLVPGDATTPGVPYLAMGIRALVPFVVSLGGVVLSAQRFLQSRKSTI